MYMNKKPLMGLVIISSCMMVSATFLASCSKPIKVEKLWEIEYPCGISKNNGLSKYKNDPNPYVRNHLVKTSSKNILQISFQNNVLGEPNKYNSMRMSVDVNTGKLLKLPEFETDPCHISNENSFHGITDGEYMYSYEFFNIICWRLDTGKVIWKKKVASINYKENFRYELALCKDSLVYVLTDAASGDKTKKLSITRLDKLTGNIVYNTFIKDYEISNVIYNDANVYLLPGFQYSAKNNKIACINANNGVISYIILNHHIPHYYSCIPNGDKMYVIGENSYSVIDLKTNKVIIESGIEFINRHGQIIDNYMMFYGTEQDYPKSYFNVLVYKINADYSLEFYKKIDLTDKDVYWPSWTTNNIDEQFTQMREPYTEKDGKYFGYDVLNDKTIWEVNSSELGENPALIYENNSERVLVFASDTKLVCYSY